MAEEYPGTILNLSLLFLLLFALLQYTDSGSLVTVLPGFDGPLPFELETGYIGVGEAEELQLFYYFIKSESNPKEDPLLVWLTGGPGCSSVCALLYENGPIAFKGDAYNGDVPSLVSTTYSWTKVASIIYIDQPVGTGFSYSTAPFIETSSDTGVAKLVADFVHNWLAEHPEFSSNPFYVAGDSYSGKVVPAIVQEISNGKYICCKPQINLQGYVLGNPVVDVDANYYDSRILFSHGMALISDELYESLKRSCGGNYSRVDPLNIECVKLIAEFEKCVEKLKIEQILLPLCNETSPDCHMYPHALTYFWANDDRVRRALQIKKGSIGEWIRCFRDIPYNKDIKSSFPYLKNNSIKGYRSLIFSGDHDMQVPYTHTQAWIRDLNFSIVDDWRPWLIDDQVGGYTRTYANKMTFVTVKGGGHTPEYAPLKSSIMFKRWLSGKTL